MKNFNVKQSGSEVILEEVNPFHKIAMNKSWKAFTPLILTSIDPNIKVGQVIREDQLEPNLWQYKSRDGWIQIPYESYKYDPIKLEAGVIRQVAKLKQPVHLSFDEWFEKLDKSQCIELEKEYGYYGHDISTTESEWEEIYRDLKAKDRIEKQVDGIPKIANIVCMDCNWRGTTDDLVTLKKRRKCPSCNSVHYSIDSHVHETPKSGHDLETCTEKEPLRGLSEVTDDELIQIAKLAHQMPNTAFKVVNRDNDMAHVEYKQSCGITYHISFKYKYGTVNANMHFDATETEPFSTCSVNIGEIQNSAKLPVPYIAIYQYLQSRNYKLPKYY